MTSYPDLVIFLPGIGGTTLTREGRPIWGGTWRAMANAFICGGVEALSVAHEDGSTDLNDGIVIGEVVKDVHVIPGLWKIDAYDDFCQTLASLVGLIEGRNFFRFPYDWRRDNRVSAHRLGEFVGQRLSDWRKTSSNEQARVIFVAHSMGGLVARYFIECLNGWPITKRLITLGTPHRGSLNALGFLVNGYAKQIGPLSLDATRPLRSFMSVHQLLPTFKCVVAEEGMQRVGETSLSNLDNRVLEAAAFHAELAEAARTNMVKDGYPAGYLSPVVSKRQPTFQSASATPTGVALFRTFEGADNGGDGTVPAVSAVPFGIDPTSATYVSGLHSKIANEESTREHVFEALRAGRVNMDRFRSIAGLPQVGLKLEDVYVAGSPFELEATVPGMIEQTLTATATPVDRGEPLVTTLHRTGASYIGSLRLGEGAWRIQVSGRATAAAEDLVLVLRPDTPVAMAPE